MSERFFMQLLKVINPHEPDKEDLRKIVHQELLGTPFSEKELTDIDISFDIAFDGHLDTPPRESGEAYIFHCVRGFIRMVRRQKQLQLFDAKLLIEMLTHDCFEEVKKEGIRPLLIYSSVQLRLGDDIAYDTCCVTKQKEKGETNHEYHERLARCDSWRPLIVKPEDRLDNIWTIGFVPKEKAKRKIRETEEWFPVFRARAERLIEIEINHKRLNPKWSFYPKIVYGELERVVRTQKIGLDIN